jgi:hypothetical protein
MHMAERGELEEVMIVAQWRPGGRGGHAEGGCWGWCMAKDWLLLRSGEAGWAKADGMASQRESTLHAAAIEDALSSTMEAACQSARIAGLSPIGASLAAYGGQARRVAVLSLSYIDWPGAQACSQRARDDFFLGVAHGEQSWSSSEPDPRVGAALHALLAPIRAAWLERGALEAMCLARGGESRDVRL